MKVNLQLSEQDIKEAVRLYVINQGYNDINTSQIIFDVLIDDRTSKHTVSVTVLDAKKVEDSNQE